MISQISDQYKLSSKQQNQLMDWIELFKNDRIVMNLQIEGLQDHITELYEENIEF